MNTYGGGFITIINYHSGSGSLNENTILTEAGDDILTESSLPLLTET